MDDRPEVCTKQLFPCPGEIYCQMGVDIEILDTGPDYVIYRCCHGYLQGPPLRIAHDAFHQNLKDGFLEKIR